MRPNLLRRIAVLAATSAVAGLAFPAGASAGLTWSANAESPWGSEWANSSCETNDRIQRVTSPHAQGDHAYRIEVRDGDDSFGERCELAQGNPPRDGYPLFNEGEERWIAFQTYLPDDYPLEHNRWQVIMQLKQLGAMGTPALAMEATDGRWQLDNSSNNGTSSLGVGKWSAPAQRNRWVKFMLHVKFSPDPDVGWVELYGDLDGSGVKELMPRLRTWTMKQEGGAAVRSHARIGIYRDPSIQGTSHILFDGHTIATDRATAEAGAFNDQPVGGGGDASGDTTSGPGEQTSRTPAPGTAAGPAVSLRGYGKRTRGRRSKLRLAGRVDRRRIGTRVVRIQVRRGGRWRSVAMRHVDSNGRFALSKRVTVGRRARTVAVRAVAGRGASSKLNLRLRG